MTIDEQERTDQAREQAEPARFSPAGIDRTSALEQRVRKLELELEVMRGNFTDFVERTMRNIAALDARTELLRTWANEDSARRSDR